MALNIKNEETHRLVVELAEVRGVSLTQAVTDAVRQDLERFRHQHSRQGLAEEILLIGRRCAAHLKEPTASSDHAEMLYDSNGLPR
jgi:antitoxin VapB